MARLIYADKLEKEMYHEAFETDSDMQKWDSGCWIRYKMFEECIGNQPTVDAVEVVHGEWEVIEDDWNEEVTYKCSNCGDELVTLCGLEIDWNYCPNCGADMRGKENASD